MIRPGSALGLLGGGQLGRMFASEAAKMGYRVTVVDPDPLAPAAQLAAQSINRAWTDPEVVSQLRSDCSAVTTEFENVPAEVLRTLAAHLPVHPRAEAVAIAQDRLVEKTFLNRIGIATAAWAPVRDEQELTRAASTLTMPVILKTARLGYDGKGQIVVSTPAELGEAWRSLSEVDCIAEERVDLEREISVVLARGSDGEVTTWPLGENHHRDGILHTTVVPAGISDEVAAVATEAAIGIAVGLEYVGVLAVECFLTGEGLLLVNEIAPRPHNSGHWTIDASHTSQFEQQVRTLVGAPLGETTQSSPIAMVNILGDLWNNGEPNWTAALDIAGTKIHLYGKQEPRPGRKMGHLTAVGTTSNEALTTALEAWESLSS